MAKDDGEAPAGEHEKPEGPPSSPQHVSFVQRLQRHFGKDLDPRVDLQADEGSVRGETKLPDPGSGSSATVQDFVKRLRPTLAGSRYDIKQEVASGGMGTILRVWDEDLRRNLAMKVMHGRGSGSSVGSDTGSGEVDPERLGRFLEEAQITGQLDHPGVVPVHDLGIDAKGRCYFTMRFVRGRELKEVFDLSRRGEEGWTRTKVLGVVLKVCEAMAYAHSKGVVHRDLKPSNVMVGRFGETYVMDWGLARVLGRRDSHDLRLKPRAEDASALSLVRTVRKDESTQNPDSPLVTMDGDVIGTPSYMAPEQARGRLEEVGPRSDVYSLGAMLYYMLTGEAPYVKPGERLSPHTVLTRVLDGPPTPIAKLSPHEPEELIAITEKAMASDAEQRYASMLELADDLQAYLENRVVRAYERGSLAEFKKWVVRNKGMAAGVAGMLLLALASGFGFAWQQRLENQRLEKQGEEIAEARDAAEDNLERARASEQAANDSAALAEQRRAEADKQRELAQKKEREAQRSGYVANLLAADFSLRLNDLAEARKRLAEAAYDKPSLRGFEWHHLVLEANVPMRDLGGIENLDALAFLPGENRVLYLSGRGDVTVKDLATNRVVPPFDLTVRSSELTSLVRSFLTRLTFDVDSVGERLAVCGLGDELVLLDLEPGEGEARGAAGLRLSGLRARTSAVAFSPSGRRLASGDDEGEILLHDPHSGEVLRRFSGHVGTVLALAFSPDSERLLSGGRDGEVAVWSVATGERLHLQRRHRGAVRAVAFDAEGDFYFSAGDDGLVYRWGNERGRFVTTYAGHEGAIHALDYDPGHERLVTAGADRTVRLWDIASGESRILRGHENPVLDVCFDGAGERLLSREKSDDKSVVYLWDALGDPATTTLSLHRRGINALAFDPAGKYLASASDDGEIVLWDALAGEPLRRLRGGHTMSVNSLAFRADGKLLLTGSQDKTARVWDVESGRPLQVLGAFERHVQAAAFLPDGERAIVATGDKRVRVIDLGTLAVLHDLTGFVGVVEDFQLSADGTRLLLRSDRETQVFDPRGDFTTPLFSSKDRCDAVALRPDGLAFVSGMRAGLLQYWDMAKRVPLLSLNDSSLGGIAFAPDGQRVITWSERRDGQVISLRDPETLETLHVLREPRDKIRCLVFSQDGTRLATGLDDGTLRIHESGGVDERRARQRAAAAQNESAGRIVEELFAEHFLQARVLEALLADASLPHEMRECALRLTNLRGDDPIPLLERSLGECLQPDLPPETYRTAFERARVATTLAGSAVGIPVWEFEALASLVRGASALRTARFGDAAKELLREHDEVFGQPPLGVYSGRERVLRQVFLCLAQRHAGQPEVAEATWREIQRSLSSDVTLTQRVELLALLDEAANLLGKGASSAGS